MYVLFSCLNGTPLTMLVLRLRTIVDVYGATQIRDVLLARGWTNGLDPCDPSDTNDLPLVFAGCGSQKVSVSTTHAFSLLAIPCLGVNWHILTFFF